MYASRLHCPVWSVTRTDLTGEETTSTPDVTLKTITPSHDRPTVSALPIPREEDKTGVETDWVIGKGKTQTVILDSCVREQKRGLFPHSDSNSAQRSNAHSHPSHRFTGWKSPRLHKEPKFNTEPLQAQEGPLTNIDTRGTFVWETLREQNNCCGCRLHIMPECGGYALRSVD